MAKSTTLPNAKDWKMLTLNVRNGLAKPLLDRMIDIDADLGLYSQAFSAMVKRNLANDIYRKAQALSKDWLPKGTAPQVLLRLIEQAAEAVTETGGVTKSTYDTAVCVGYEVALANWKRVAPNVWRAAYKGGKDDYADMLMRCQNMCTAIGEAYDAYQGAYPPPAAAPSGLRPPDKRLRIFMAPEFFFRGRHGAYDDTVAFEILPRLRQETKKSRYRNWLFVLGTFIMATFVEETICPQCRVRLKKDMGFRCTKCQAAGVKIEGATIDNVALIRKGGEAGSDNSYWVTKEYVSPIDFRRPVAPAGDWDHNRDIMVRKRLITALPTEGSRDLTVRPIGSKFQDERMGGGGSVFEIDGIRFGLEICLDHAKNRLKGDEGVSVQLVPSCGMELKAFKCVPDGLYFGVDGNTQPFCQVGINGGDVVKTLGIADGLNEAIPFVKTPCSAGGDIVVFGELQLP
jgi:hypothetical protein